MTSHHEQLILKFLHGTISSEEQKLLDSWLSESSENQKALEGFKQIWQLSANSTNISDFQTKAEWAKLESSLTTHETPVHALNESRPLWLKVAASILLLTVASFVVYLTLFRPQEIFHEATNDSQQFSLPDGSVVWLNKESKITYTEDFDENRGLTLEGEAFFDVVKNPGKPFVIHIGKANVEVLGTSFNVKANDPEPEVFVVTGLVRFSNENNTSFVELKPGETGVLSEGYITQKAFENTNALAWKDKRLIFKKTSLKDVVETLEDYFNITINVNNSNLLGCRFTSSFDKPTWDEVVEALSVSLNLNIVRQNNVYVLDGDGCNE